jgi:hypothetical protein
VVKRFLLNRVSVERAWVSINHRVQAAAAILPYTANAPLAISNDAVMRAKVATDVASSMRNMTIGNRKTFLGLAVTGRAGQRSFAFE